MLGLGRPVIWLCKESDRENAHFDARQYNTIYYQDVEELESRLQHRIEAILGRDLTGENELRSRLGEI
jgi:hypothetical protein